MKASSELAEEIVTALEGRFRDWLIAGEHAEAKELVAEILERECVHKELVARTRSISSALVRLQNGYSVETQLEIAKRLCANTEAREPGTR